MHLSYTCPGRPTSPPISVIYIPCTGGPVLRNSGCWLPVLLKKHLQCRHWCRRHRSFLGYGAAGTTGRTATTSSSSSSSSSKARAIVNRLSRGVERHAQQQECDAECEEHNQRSISFLLLRDGRRAGECRCFVHHDTVVVVVFVSVRFGSVRFGLLCFVSNKNTR